MAERVIQEGAVREGKVAADIGPEDARNLLEAWLAGVGLDVRGRELLAYLQADGFSHADLYRRARRIHDRRLRGAVESGAGAFAAGNFPAAVNGLFEALVPAFPYAPSTAFLAAEKAKLSAVDGAPRRVALIADGIGSMHGVTHTIEQIRERGVPGFEIDVIGTDPGVDRRLPAAAELELPFYAGMRLGVPGVPDLVETLAEGRYDLVHVTAPGPAGDRATLLARITGVPLLASYHTELAAYAGLRSGDAGIEALARIGLGAFYRAPGHVLSPSPSADDSLAALGAERARIGRWERGRRPRPLRPGRRPTATPSRARSRSSTPAGSPARRASTCSPTASSAPTSRTRACTCCWRAAARRRTSCGRSWARRRPSSAGSAARTSPAPTPAPTSSSSPAPPTPTAR